MLDPYHFSIQTFLPRRMFWKVDLMEDLSIREPGSVEVGCWVTLAHQLLRISLQAPGKEFPLMNFLSPFLCRLPRLLVVPLQVRILFDPPK